MNKKTKKTIMMLALLLLILGIGYATFTANLNINGTTTILNNNFSVKFLNVIEKSGSVTATTPAAIDEETGTTVSFAAQLEKPGDYYGFSIDITNDGTLDAMVDSVTMTELTEAQKKYLTYEIMDKDGLKVNNKDLLIKGETRTVTILVSYKAEPEAYPEGITEIIDLSFSINYVESDNSAVDTNTYFTDEAVYPVIQETYSDLSSRSGVMIAAYGWAYRDFDSFAGKTITKVSIPVYSVLSLQEQQCLTMAIYDRATFEVGSTNLELKRTKDLCITTDQLSKYTNTTIKDWVTIDIEDEKIAENEVIGFGIMSDDISYAYLNDSTAPTNLLVYTNVREGFGSKTENFRMLIDVYVKKTEN